MRRASLLFSGLFLLVWACSRNEPTPSPRTGQGAPQTLVIPATNPALDAKTGHDPAAEFVPEPAFYGEHSWDDVRMRVIQHVAMAGRDLARLHAASGDFEQCSASYENLVRRLDAIPCSSPTGEPIRQILAEAASRDQALCLALANGVDPPDPGSGVASLRARTLGLLRRAKAGEDVSTAAAELARSQRGASGDLSLLVPRNDLDLFAFTDFDQRHALRVRLVQAYADEVDPLFPTDPWGYREATEGPRQALALVVALEQMGEPGQSVSLLGPSLLAGSSSGKGAFSTAEMALLPTGDSSVDVAGFPGPRAIGTLERLSPDDAEWMAWLASQAGHLAGLAPAEVPAAIDEIEVAIRSRYPFSSSYYNAKQVRDTAIRVLARQGHAYEAALALRGFRPLHNQDWACPDRPAILSAIEGRLLLLAGDAEAQAVLERALSESDDFLARIAGAERQVRGRLGQGPARGPSTIPQ
jgi:hypothetical protein